MARSHYDWPFLNDAHRALAAHVEEWAASEVPSARALASPDLASRELVRRLGGAGILRHAVAVTGALDARAICIVREVLASHWGLADFAFAMQGLGSTPIALYGSPELKERYLPRVASGDAVAAFAISERGAGSDLAAVATTARRDGDEWVLDGEKAWISNGGLADFYVVFARTGEGEGAKGLTAFVVDAGARGVDTSQRVDIVSPHPMAMVRLDGCRVPATHRIGEGGRGIAVALATLDVFRASVGAAAVGFARRALAEAAAHAVARRQFGARLSDLQMVQAKLADMVCAIDASALLVYRAAWVRDTAPGRVTLEAAVAKCVATESAQHVIDDAVQILGAMGVVAGARVEELYREIRPLRIYEGATDVQKLVIARELLTDYPTGGA